MSSELVVRELGMRAYLPTWQAMQAFTAQRGAATPDEIWLLQHPPVYTLGRNAKQRPQNAAIPLVACDRGGDITYHGPGQVVLYTLLDLTRRGHGVKVLVNALEQTVIDFLGAAGIAASRRTHAPGVYVGARKIAALGLRVRHGCSYHGLALNIDMDLAPFATIAPCGYPGLEVTQCRDLGLRTDCTAAGRQLAAHFLRIMGYNRAQIDPEPTDVCA